MRNFFIRAAVLAIAGVGSAVAQEHFDAMPVLDPATPGFMPTGSFDFDGFSVEQLPQQTVYGNDLEDAGPGTGVFVGETGFTALSATAAATQLAGTGFSNLAGGLDLRFDFRSFTLPGSSAQANLFYWDGADTNGNMDPSDDIAFAPATGAILTLEKDGGLTSAAVSGVDLATPGFVIGATAFDNPGTPGVDETGFLHLDLDALLDDGDGDGLTSAAAGIYVMSMRLSVPGAASAPIFWVYNVGLGEEGEAAHDAAIDFVPEPAAGLMLLTLGAFVLRMRR